MMKKEKNNFDNKDIEFLQTIFSYAKNNWDNYQDSDKPASEIFDVNFRYLLKLAGYDGLPKIVSNDKFNGMDSKVYYRGAKEFKHTAELLTAEDFRLGQGYMGGIFGSPIVSVAIKHTKKTPNTYGIPNRVLKFKLDSYKKIFKRELASLIVSLKNGEIPSASEEVKNKLAALAYFIESIDNILDKTNFFKFFASDLSKLAIYLGYDFIYDDTYPATKALPNIVVLNRGAMTVSKNEYDRFVLKCFESDPRGVNPLEK